MDPEDVEFELGDTVKVQETGWIGEVVGIGLLRETVTVQFEDVPRRKLRNNGLKPFRAGKWRMKDVEKIEEEES